MSNSYSKSVTIHWEKPRSFSPVENVERKSLYFTDAEYTNTWAGLPSYQMVIDDYYELELIPTISNEMYIPLSEEEAQIMRTYEEFITNKAGIEIKKGIQNKIHKNIIEILPFRRSTSGNIEKLVSFDINVTSIAVASNKETNPGYSNKSAFAEGKWYKIRLKHNGIYKITYEDLKNMGIDVDNIVPSQFGIFGNGGDMLPEQNNIPRIDDIAENAIYFHGEEDNSFDPDDYVLFYGDSPHFWDKAHLQDKFIHTKHYTESYSYYFISPDQGSGKRISDQGLSNNPNQEVSTFDEMHFYEENKVNLTHSGRDWHGEMFTKARNTFSIPEIKFHDIVKNSEVLIEAKVAAKSTKKTTFDLSYNDKPAFQLSISPISLNNIQDFAFISNVKKWLPENGSNINIKLVYNADLSTAKGWLNYVRVIGRSNLKFKGKQFNFRDYNSVKGKTVTKFKISNATNKLMVWDVSDKTNAKNINGNLNGSEYSFAIATNTLREFVAFDGSDYKTVEFVKEIPNQNLHGIRDMDMVIVAYKDFLLEAEKIAQLHRDHDNFNVFVTSTEPIYNEFSSGSKDVTALRDFFRMLYLDSSTGKELKYVLLLGDGSYDQLNKIDNNTNFIPTFQSRESLDNGDSFTSDDYFGLMDHFEGYEAIGFMDIGVGRLPVRTEKEAEAMYRKIKNYMEYSPDNAGDWKNRLLLVADDQDKNSHLNQAEELSIRIDSTGHELTIDKLYLDAYEQISTPNGNFYPEVRSTLNKAVEDGVLLINYVGHGGEYGWSHEQILTISDIDSWKNKNMLPLFITATCEFSRYDNPELLSAGERVILNEHGGGIAMFTTTRIAFSTTNYSLNRGIYNYLFIQDDEGFYPRIGDVLRWGKTNSQQANRNVHLLGDPALRLIHPKAHVKITSINHLDPDIVADTLKAYMRVTIKGEVRYANGNRIEDFNGIAFPSVYDKISVKTTLGNDYNSFRQDFSEQTNIIYKGETEVTNGVFSFSFIVPKDISYNYGSGKISIYAKSDKLDASGHTENVVIGGFSENAIQDVEGPQIKLYMNDETFTAGDTILEDPVLIAEIYDKNGINTLSTSIGHDITAVLDGKVNAPYILNNYYKANQNKYQEGVVRYRLKDLEDGEHVVELKVWDVMNNSSTASTSFYVAQDLPLNLSEMIGFPNPFSETTSFTFKHDHYGKTYNLNVQIFSTDGRLVKDLGKHSYQSNGYSSEPLIWDGTDNRGNRLKSGVYIYRFTVEGENGIVETKSEKIVLLD